jgi:hypothetical protein
MKKWDSLKNRHKKLYKLGLLAYFWDTIGNRVRIFKSNQIASAVKTTVQNV